MWGRVLATAAMAAVLVGGLAAIGGPASGSVVTHHGPRCFAGDVRGLSIKEARVNLDYFGCSPGAARDGHHYVVRTTCGSIDRWGVVVRQRPKDVILGRHQRLVVYVGVAGEAAGCPPIVDPASITEPFDGAYLGAFTTTSTPSEFLPAGSVFPGLSFEVEYGEITGDMTGTLSGLGVSTDAVISIDGRVCRPVTDVRFVASANGQAVAGGDMVCTGAPALTGLLQATKQ